MTDKKLNRSMDGMKQIIAEHVPYEIDMLRYTFYRLMSGNLSQGDGNAYIESFSVHARNLIDFFRDNDKISDGTAVARHFTDNEYQPFSQGGPNKKTYGKLSEHVAHLSYNRTATPTGKLGPQDRIDLINLINTEVHNFSNHLNETYKPNWRADLTTPNEKIVVNSGFAAPSATIMTASMAETLTIVNFEPAKRTDKKDP